MKESPITISLTPHHLIDVFKHLVGNRWDLLRIPPRRQAMHEVAKKILTNHDAEIKLIHGHDDICRDCQNLNGNSCNGILAQFTPSIPKSTYNDELDNYLFELLQKSLGDRTSVRNFLKKVISRKEEIIPLATHLGENEKYTVKGLATIESFLKEKLSINNNLVPLEKNIKI